MWKFKVGDAIVFQARDGWDRKTFITKVAPKGVWPEYEIFDGPISHNAVISLSGYDAWLLGTSQKYHVGDDVEYFGSKATVTGIAGQGLWGETYEVTDDSGNYCVAYEVELAPWNPMTPKLPTGVSFIDEAKGPKHTGGCECGAWATTFKDDHMGFCPKFTSNKIKA